MSLETKYAIISLLLFLKTNETISNNRFKYPIFLRREHGIFLYLLNFFFSFWKVLHDGLTAKKSQHRFFTQINHLCIFLGLPREFIDQLFGECVRGTPNMEAHLLFHLYFSKRFILDPMVLVCERNYMLYGYFGLIGTLWKKLGTTSFSTINIFV